MLTHENTTPLASSPSANYVKRDRDDRSGDQRAKQEIPKRVTNFVKL